MAMSTGRKVVLTILGIVLGLVLVVVVGIAIVVSAVRGNRPSIRDNSVLALKISGPMPDHRVQVKFDEPQRAITPGQATVFYRGDEVVGGGWIVKTR